MKNKKKILSLCLAASLLATTLPVHAAGGWSQASDGNWTYTKTDGSTAKGWLFDANCWYFLDETTGVMKKGWIASGSNWFWLSDTSGIMQYETWVKDGGKDYYVGEDGSMAKGQKNIKGKTYTFLANGELVGEKEESNSEDGWKKEGNQYYYYKDDVKQSGWITVNDKKYYLGGSDDRMLIGTQVIDGKTYEFATNGALISEGKDVYDYETYLDEKESLVELINIDREDKDTDEFGWIKKDGLDKVAYVRAQELVNKFDLARPSGTLNDLLKDNKVEADYVEQYFVKADTAVKAFKAFKENPVVKRALLDGDLTTISVGVAKSGSTYIWLILLTEEEGVSYDDYDSSAYRSDKKEILEYLNDARYDEDLDDLVLAYRDDLDEAAFVRALEILDTDSAKRPEGDSYESILDEYDVDYGISYQLYDSDVVDYEDMVDDFLAKTSGRRAINNSKIDTVGIGIAQSRGQKVVVLLLIQDEESDSGYSSSAYKTDKNALLTKINSLRTTNSESKLTLGTSTIDELAYDRAYEIAKGTDEYDIEEFLDDNDFSYRYAYEIVAYDLETVNEVYKDIISYTSDKYELISSDYTKVAIGIAEVKSEKTWVIILYK